MVKKQWVFATCTAFLNQSLAISMYDAWTEVKQTYMDDTSLFSDESHILDRIDTFR